jgi:hypothetical protein
MTGTPNLESTGIGLRMVRVALRDTDGTIAVPSGTPVGTPYGGHRISGANALTVTLPESQKVSAKGDDRIFYTFNLPPTESPSGELRVSKFNATVAALLTDTNVFGSTPWKKVGLGTNKQGEEPAIVLWGSSQAVDVEEGSSTFGVQIWQTYIFLNALASLVPSPKEESNVTQWMYRVIANDSAVDELGSTLTEAIHGFTAAPYIMVVSPHKFWIDAFEGKDSETEFTLSQTPASGAVLNVSLAGVVQTLTTHYTVSEGVVTMLAPPADGVKLLVEYGYD